MGLLVLTVVITCLVQDRNARDFSHDDDVTQAMCFMLVCCCIVLPCVCMDDTAYDDVMYVCERVYKYTAVERGMAYCG